ncbi:phosphoglucomutase [Sporosarcina luteola]|nr:phosphoglucomutase [Sporosarcina luteola]
MSNYLTVYKEWATSNMMLPHLQEELSIIRDDQKEIEERFYQYVTFGTGGMRGLLGVGTNRINIFTIRRVAEGLALYIQSVGEEAVRRGVVIAYDTRHFSKEFAIETAKVLGGYGIRSYVFEESRPTPELSFAVRYYKAFAGVVITASHNPKEYNGFKVYGEDGGQLTPTAASEITRFMDNRESLFSIKLAEVSELLQSGTMTYVLSELDSAYYKHLLTLQETEQTDNDLKIVFTPLHGAGLVPVVEGLKAYGYRHVFMVNEQAIQDPDFPTVLYPNPEEREAFQLAIELGERNDADLLIATDPDADRLGIAVRTNIGYQLISGNQLGALLLHYILNEKHKKGTLPNNGVVLKSIVTSEMGRAIAASFGVSTIDTLTGFKYISEKIEEFHVSGEFKFLFGYEESYGYLIGDFVRDKDAVQAALLTAEMAGHYHKQGISLYEKLIELYNQFGYYKESLQSITLIGIEGKEKIANIMATFRDAPPTVIAGSQVIAVEDYLTGITRKVDGQSSQLNLPKENVIKLVLEDGSWICIRPSGTEPKCKFYFAVCRDSERESTQLLAELEKEIMARVNQRE